MINGHVLGLVALGIVACMIISVLGRIRELEQQLTEVRMTFLHQQHETGDPLTDSYDHRDLVSAPSNGIIKACVQEVDGAPVMNDAARDCSGADKYFLSWPDTGLMQSHLVSLRESIQALEDDVATNADSISTAFSLITTLRADVDSFNATTDCCDSMTSNLTEVAEGLDAVNATVKANTNSLLVLDDFASYQSELIDTMNMSVVSLNRAFKALETNLTDLDEDLDGLSETVTSHEESNTTNQGIIEWLEASMSNLSDTSVSLIATLRADVDALNATAGTLISYCESMKSNLTQVFEGLDAVNATVGANTLSLLVVNDIVSYQSELIDTMNTSVVSLSQSITALETNVTDLDEDLKVLNETILSNAESIVSNQGDIEWLEESLSSLGDIVDENTIKLDYVLEDLVPPYRIVFASSTSQTANLGGLDGADALCQQLASNAGINGTFQSWLSNNTHAAKDRLAPMTNTAIPAYALVDGTLIASNFSDLLDGGIINPINLDEYGERATGSAWTGTLRDGSSANGHVCGEWESEFSLWYGQLGKLPRNDYAWTEYDQTNCHSLKRVYCFQQFPI